MEKNADQLVLEIDGWIDELRSDMETYDENAAVHQPEDGLTTDERAIKAVLRPERFRGEHQVARMWLVQSPSAHEWFRRSSKRRAREQ